MPAYGAAASGRRHSDLERAYAWCGGLLLVTSCAPLVLLFLPPEQVPVFWVILPVACTCAAALVAWRLPKAFESQGARSVLVWLGPAFFAFAATADISATLWHSPALEEEANLLVRPLLSRWPLHWIFAGAAVFQVAFLSLSISLWWNLLARWSWYLEELRTCNGIPLWLSMLGVRRGSWLKLLGLGIRAEMALVIFAIYMPWAYLGRVYLAMEWMGWVPISRWAMPIGLLVAALVTHWLVLRHSMKH